LANLGEKRQSLEELFERSYGAQGSPRPSVYSDIASLDRCTLLLREATRALQGGYLTAWVQRFSCGDSVPLVLQARKKLEDMANIDEGRYGPAVRELGKGGAGFNSEEHSDAVMDAVITLVVEMQFSLEKREELLSY
jgi:hypothetical protein